MAGDHRLRASVRRGNCLAGGSPCAADTPWPAGMPGHCRHRGGGLGAGAHGRPGWRNHPERSCGGGAGSPPPRRVAPGGAMHCRPAPVGGANDWGPGAAASRGYRGALRAVADVAAGSGARARGGSDRLAASAGAVSGNTGLCRTDWHGRGSGARPGRAGGAAMRAAGRGGGGRVALRRTFLSRRSHDTGDRRDRRPPGAGGRLCGEAAGDEAGNRRSRLRGGSHHPGRRGNGDVVHHAGGGVRGGR